jgi:hypothetical protein
MSGSSISISISISGRPQVRRFDRLRVKFSPTLPAASPAPPSGPSDPSDPSDPSPHAPNVRPARSHSSPCPHDPLEPRGHACRRAHDTTLGPPRPTATAGEAPQPEKVAQPKRAPHARPAQPHASPHAPEWPTTAGHACASRSNPISSTRFLPSIRTYSVFAKGLSALH